MDEEVRLLLSTVFENREITMVDINGIAPGGGGIHCITQQQPAWIDRYQVTECLCAVSFTLNNDGSDDLSEH